MPASACPSGITGLVVSRGATHRRVAVSRKGHCVSAQRTPNIQENRLGGRKPTGTWREQASPAPMDTKPSMGHQRLLCHPQRIVPAARVD
jgi:hypothetical protein